MCLASGKLAAVMHVAVILQDCLARHTVIVLAKPFTKHENEARRDNEDEGDSTEEEGS